MNTCTMCRSTQLVQRRVHRHGGLAVFLGYFLLVPALLVGVLGTMGVIAPRTPPDPARALATRQRLEDAGVPARVAERVSAGQQVVESELAALAAEQRKLVASAQMAVADDGTRATIERLTAGNGYRVLLAAAATCAITGWWLVRKRRVTQCSSCGVIAV